MPLSIMKISNKIKKYVVIIRTIVNQRYPKGIFIACASEYDNIKER